MYMVASAMPPCTMVGVLVAVVLLELALSRASGAHVYRVGGDKGWVVGLVNFTEWAANYTFYAGDTLVFSYEAGVHTVAEVSRSSYEECSTASAKASYVDGNTRIALREAGSYYFICGVVQHCPAGQKLQVLVLEAPARPAPTPAPSLVVSPGGPLPPIVTSHSNLGVSFLHMQSWSTLVTLLSITQFFL